MSLWSCMSLWSWASSLIAALPSFPWRIITGTAKELSGSAKDISGIRRDHVETQLAKKKLEDYEAQIYPATLSDVEEYDPNTRRVIAAGRYQIGRRSASGGMGTIFDGLDVLTNERVVIKAYRPVTHSLLDEADLLKGLAHTNIVAVRDVIHEDDGLFIVTERLRNISLAEYFSNIETEGTTTLCINILPPLASALDYIHSRGILHLDVNPESILIEPERVPKLSDFGFAMRVVKSDGALVKSGSVSRMGYSAPEQLSATADVTAQSDQFALAVVACECIVGDKPIFDFAQDDDGGSHWSTGTELWLKDRMSAHVGAALQQALAFEPSARFATCSAFAQQFVAALRRT